MYGSVRGASGDWRPYRNKTGSGVPLPAVTARSNRGNPCGEAVRCSRHRRRLPSKAVTLSQRMSSTDGRLPSLAPKVVVATTVALSFISFWRGASIVLSDLASSAFYAGGAAEQAIGKSAPWFVLGVMLFSFAVRSVYMESCSMFVRGGVYVVVNDSMGPV